MKFSIINGFIPSYRSALLYTVGMFIQTNCFGNVVYKSQFYVSKVLKPPAPPSKEAKPATSTVEETAEEPKAEKMLDKSPDTKKKTGPPPTPPAKPIGKSNPAESRQPSHPPAPPCKDKKPFSSAVDSDPHVQDTGGENGEDNSKIVPKLADKIPWTKGQDSDEEPPVPTENSGNSTSAPTKTEVPSKAVSLNEPLDDGLNLSPLLGHLSVEKKKKAEEKSVDSGQHSDDDSEGSGSEDVLAASTAALRGSNAGLDVLDTSEDATEISESLQPTVKHDVRSKIFPFRRTVPKPPQKPSKVRSASIGDLLSPAHDVVKLESEVAVEMEKTSELLSKVSQSQEGGDKENTPEDLLARAMEKLKMAEHVLREVKKLKLAKNLNNRKSW